MRGLIINFALAAAMTGLFTAIVGTQVGMAVSAARHGSQVSVAHAPVGPKAGASHAISGSPHPPAS
jgi:hypothetical protein